MSEKYKFLETKPLGQDLFEGKSQERISKVICDIVEDDKFKVIGIDGGWGTGKSNLVQMVDDQLPNHEFFLYDVWGHQEDEQRKAILVELTDFITNEKEPLVKNKRLWKENLKKLLSNEREVTTINKPYLSVGFILSLLSIIYIPTVNTLVRSSNGYESFAKDWWRILIILIPILLVIFIYSWKVVYQISKKKKGWESFKIALEQTFQVYTNKQEEETKIETISENQPSVRDFRNWMENIDKDLKDKKLVLVFDNFDRLPKKHILSVWSVIHIFFAEQKYKNIKIVIPFDRKHIRNAFKELNGENQKEKGYANDYINKTFDIVYRVAPPILTSWKVFFKSNWKKAFKDYDKTEYLIVEQAYEVLRPHITPRELLAFINDIVALKLLDDSIPDRYLAVFVLNNERIIEKPLKAITDTEYLEGIEYLFKEDENFDKFITALAYQIPPDNSLEVVYKKELRDCLMNSEKENLLQLSKTKVFSRILPSVISEISNYNKTIDCLNNLGDDAEISSHEIQYVWNSIYLNHPKIELKEGKLEDFELILLKRVSKNYKSGWTDKIIGKLYIGIDEFNSTNFADNIDKLDTFCKENEVDINVFKKLKYFEIDIDKFKNLVESRQHLYSKYNLSCPKEMVEGYLSERTVNNFGEASFIFYLDYKNELNQFHQLLKSFIKGNEGNPDLLKSIFKFLKHTSSEPLEKLLAENHVQSLINQLKIGDGFLVDLTCMRFQYGTQSHPSYQKVYEKVLLSEDDDFHNDVAREIESYIKPDDFLLSSINFNNPLVKSVVDKLLKMDKERELNVEKILLKFHEICEINEIDPIDLFEVLDKTNPNEFDFEFLDKLSIATFRKANSCDTDISNNIIEEYKNYFKEADSEVWDKTFEDLNCQQIEILLLLEFNDWNSYAVSSFKDKMISIIDTNESDQLDKVNILAESFISNGTSLNNTFKNIRDHIIHENNLNNDEFIAFAPLLVKYGSLEDRSGEVLRTIYKSEFLDNEECLDMIIKNAEVLSTVLKKSTRDEKSDFIEAVKDRMDTSEDIDGLAQRLSISSRSKSKKKETNKNEEE